MAATRLGTDDKRYPVTPPRGAAGKAKGGRRSGGYQNADALRKHTATERNAHAMERTAAALEKLADAVTSADEHITRLLDDLAPEHAPAVERHAERMVAAWRRVADRARALAGQAEVV